MLSTTPPTLPAPSSSVESRPDVTLHEIREAAAADLPRLPRDPVDLLLRTAIVLGLAGVLWITFASDAFGPLLRAAEHHRWGTVARSPSILWAAMGSILLCVRTALWFR